MAVNVDSPPLTAGPGTPSPSSVPPQLCTPVQHFQTPQGHKNSEHGGESSEEDAKVERSEAGEENVRKRRRLDGGISSCEICKQRKVKCDRQQPRCGWCSRNGQECIYRQKKKPGLRAGIGRELEERLDRVEAMLASHSRILDAQQSPMQAFTNGHNAAQFPSPTTTAHMSPPLIPVNVAQAQPPLPPPTPAHAILRERNPRETADLDLSASRSFDGDLPTDDILCTMIDLFFQNIHPTCPILHRQTVLDSFFQRRPSEVEDSDIILMHAIVAAALRFSTDKRLEPGWKKHFRQLAKQKVMFYALEHPSVQSLRAMVLIVLDVVAYTNGPSGWGLLAVTTRMALHLGLAVEPAREPHPQISTMGVGHLPASKDWIEDEGRRRLFWYIYILDVMTSLGTSLDLTIEETEVERQLPCRDSLWDRNQQTSTRWFRAPRKHEQNVNNVESLSAFSYQIEVVGILGRIHRFLRETVDINVLSDVEAWQLKYRTLDKALTSWKYSLPMSYGNLTRALNMGGTSIEPSWVMLHAIYNTAVIRLHSSAAYPTSRSSIFGPSYSAGQRCLSAVENIAALTRLVLDSAMIPALGSTFAFTVWVAARLVLVHASTTESQSIPDVRLFLDALREMGKLWQTAERYYSIIQRVVDELMLLQIPTGSASSDSGEARNCVSILSDMRMTAYAVDVLISRQPDMRQQRALEESTGVSGLLAGLGDVNGTSNGGANGAGTSGMQPVDYMDVFSWFNFPRTDSTISASQSLTPVPPAQEDSDWLFPV